jgi:hypothetical protein
MALPTWSFSRFSLIYVTVSASGGLSTGPEGSVRFPKLDDETVPFFGLPYRGQRVNDLPKQWLVEPPMPGVVREKVMCWKEYVYPEGKDICAYLDRKRKVSVKQSPEVNGPKTDELAAQVESLSLGDAVK